MAHSAGRGIGLAFVCLVILGIMPIISNGRPAGFGALSFALFLSLWQVLFALPLFVREAAGRKAGLFDPGLATGARSKILAVVLSTGVIFGLSTYVYVLAFEKAGAVSAAIAVQAYPLFAILWETVFLNRRKSGPELFFTALLLAALFYLATDGTGRIDDLSVWFLLALCIPFLWSVAHVILREMLTHTPVTPAQVTFFRVLVSSAFLLVALIATGGTDRFMADMARIDFQAVAILMGLVYYLELITWFHAVRHIDVSVASSITVPAPALTMVLAIVFLNESVEAYQLVTLSVVIVSIYGLLLAGRRRARAAA